MIRVRVKRNRGGRPAILEVKGHALFASQGSDIVCAAVSMLTQTVVYALQDLVRLDFPVRIGDGYLQVFAPSVMTEEEAEKFNLLMETMLLGLKETARSYPGHIIYTDRLLCRRVGRCGKRKNLPY